MSSRVDPSKTVAETREPSEPRERDRGKKRAAAPAPSGRGGRFDKAFPVWLEGDRGVASGIARNVTETGMFVETREPFPLSSRVRVTFVSPARAGTEMTLEAEVRYQCFINFAKPGEGRGGMRGIGLKFTSPLKGDARKGTIH
jgi:hypothetical protein